MVLETSKIEYKDSPKFVEDLADNLMASIANICPPKSDNLKKVGEVALKKIADYPLYAATSNISYTTAIMVAVVCGYEYQELLAEAGILKGVVEFIKD